jgi:hypothetical protein
MKTAISIPDTLFEAAERAAARLQLSRSELYQRALTAFLADQDDGRITAALNEVYGSDPATSEVDAVLRHLQAASIKPERW